MTTQTPQSGAEPAFCRPLARACWPLGQPLGSIRRWAQGGLLACLVASQTAMAAQALKLEQAEIRQPRASFVDVNARMKLLRGAVSDPHLKASLPGAVDCASATPVLPPVGAMVIPPRYLSGNRGAVHPGYESAVKLYRDFEDTAALWANAYVASGEKRYATCVLDHLHRWAQAGALLDYPIATTPGTSNQVWYQVEWSVSAASLALSQVLGAFAPDDQRVNTVIDWMQRVSSKQISYPGGENTCCNNHAYWRGVHATMVGVLANDTRLFRWGLGRYALAMNQLAADGSWPLEMARGELSLHYQNYALLPLVMIAEIAAQQGLDLYAIKGAAGQDLHGAIAFLAAKRAQIEALPAAARPKLDLRAFAPGRSDQTWGEFYRARFGRDPLGLLSRPTFGARTGGNATLLAYQPPLPATAMAPVAPAAPAARIDLRPWKLQMPDEAATDIGPERLLQGFRSPYFEVEPGGSLLFTAPVGGGLTATAKYTRSELREMLDPADKARNWTAQGRHRMTLRQEVLQPPRSGRVVVFQIHAIQPDGGSAPPLVKAQWRDNRMQFLVKALASGGRDILHEVADVPLNMAYDAALTVDKGKLVMEINGTTITDNFVERDPKWQDLRFYFKAGNYPQDASKAEGNVSVVRIHALTVRHD